MVQTQSGLFITACRLLLYTFFESSVFLYAPTSTHSFATMPSITKCLALFTFALSASALTTPHAARSLDHHRAVAAHVVAANPEPAKVPRSLDAGKAVRRRSTGRCKPRSSSSSSSSSESTPTSTPAASAVANVAPTPPPATEKTSSTHSAKPTHSTHSSSSTASDPSSSSGGGSSAGGSGNKPSYLIGTQTGQGIYILLLDSLPK